MSDQTIPNGQTQPGEDRTRPSAQSEPDGQARPAAQTETRRKIPVREAAQILGTTVEGVRSRIKRGSLDSMRVDGTVYVLVAPDQADRARPDDRASPSDDQSHPGDQARPDPSLHRLVDEQREMIDWLKREVERKDTILMQMARRIPELEAPREAPREAAQSARTASDPRPGKGNVPSEKKPPPTQRSFWARLFGSE